MEKLPKFPLRVYSKNYFYSGESQFYFRGGRFWCCYFPFILLKILFFIWMPTQLSTEKHWLTFCHSAGANCVISFMTIKLTSRWPVFPSAEAASLILAEVYSSSYLLVLAPLNLNFNSCLFSGAPNHRFLSNAFKRCFRLSGVLLKLCRLTLGCSKKNLSVRLF